MTLLHEIFDDLGHMARSRTVHVTLGIGALALLLLGGGAYVMAQLGGWRTLSCRTASDLESVGMLLLFGFFAMAILFALGETIHYLDTKEHLAARGWSYLLSPKHLYLVLAWVAGVAVLGGAGWAAVGMLCR